MNVDYQLTTYLYGPQTAGKSSRLLRIIQRDHGQDLAFSGEDNFIDNGKSQVKVTAPLPANLTVKATHRFQERVKPHLHYYPPIKHILIDGAQFLSINQIKWLQLFFVKQSPQIPIIFSGCLYYLDPTPPSDDRIPSSQFLLRHCSRTVAVKRRCEFCHRNASRLWVNKISFNTHHTIITQDPHLVCNYHYHVLNLKRAKDKT